MALSLGKLVIDKFEKIVSSFYSEFSTFHCTFH